MIDAIPSRFWIKWLAAEDLERIEIIKDLQLCKTVAKLYYPKLDNESALDTIATMLNSYFEDLLDAVRLETRGMRLNGG
jgi:hypothetical protein